jgi:hypothetical protein
MKRTEVVLVDEPKEAQEEVVSESLQETIENSILEVIEEAIEEERQDKMAEVKLVEANSKQNDVLHCYGNFYMDTVTKCLYQLVVIENIPLNIPNVAEPQYVSLVTQPEGKVGVFCDPFEVKDASNITKEEFANISNHLDDLELIEKVTISVG